MKRKNFAVLIEILLDLLTSGISLFDALKITGNAKNTKKVIKLAALHIVQELQCGQRISNAIVNNPYVLVPREYSGVLYSSEKSGTLTKALDFIVRNEKRKTEIKSNIVKSAVYPAVILLISLFGLCILTIYESSFTYHNNHYNSLDGAFYSMLFIFLSVCVYCFLVHTIFKDPDSYLFLLTFSFFLEEGFDIYTSITHISLQFNPDSRTRNSIVQCSELLNKGFAFHEAAGSLHFLNGNALMNLEYMDETANVADTIQRMLSEERKRVDRIRSIFLALCEPSMILCTGVYLLLLLQFSIMPLFTSFGGML